MVLLIQCKSLADYLITFTNLPLLDAICTVNKPRPEQNIPNLSARKCINGGYNEKFISLLEVSILKFFKLSLGLMPDIPSLKLPVFIDMLIATVVV